MRLLIAALATAVGVAATGRDLPAPAHPVSSDAIRLVRVPEGGIQPQAAVDSRGVLHLLYFAGEPGSGNLLYARSTDGGSTFSGAVRVNSGEGSAIATGTIRGGQIALGRNGRVHVVWNGSATAKPGGLPHPRTGRATMPMLYTRSNERGTAFEAERSLMTHTYNLDGGGSIAADGSGHVAVAWHAQDAAGGDDTERTRRVWLARSADEGRTFSRETAAWDGATGACGCCGLSLFSPSPEVLLALYRSAATLTDRDVYLLGSSDGGRSFRGTRVHEWDIGACPMTSMSFAAAGSRIYGAWETAGQVYFGEIDARVPAIAVPVAPPGSAARKHPRLAVNRSGDVLLVWTEGTAWARGGALAWQVFVNAAPDPARAGRQPGIAPWSFAAAAALPDGRFAIVY